MKKLETDRLILRLYEETDRGDFVRLLMDPEVMEFVRDGALSEERADAIWKRVMTEWYPNGPDIVMAIIAKDDLRYAGHAILRPRPDKKEDWEVGYYLHKSEWGNGLASEAAMRLVEYAFDELALPEIYGTVDADNAASIRALEKTGLSFHREEYDKDGKFLVYRLARAPYAPATSDE